MIREDEEKIERMFSYHKPSADSVEDIAVLREAHKELARMICERVIAGPERDQALQNLHQCSMWCNYGIVKYDPIGG